MILVAGAILLIASVPLLGGRLGRLETVRFRRGWLLVTALVIQVAVLQVLHDSVAVLAAAVLHVVSYALALAFVWANRSIPGLWLVSIGGAANFAVIAANGGVMPASPAAAAAAGRAVTTSFENSAVVDEPRLAFLGDVFAWPQPLPLANVFSLGDVLLLVGAAVLLHTVTQSRLRFRLRRSRIPLP